MMKFFELLQDTKKLIIFAITCLVICLVGKYRDFDFVKIGTFELSFDFMFFVSLVGCVVSSVILIGKILNKLLFKIKNFLILRTLESCSPEEKDFLYNRVYENDNELVIDMNIDNYFYKLKKIHGIIQYSPYKPAYNTKESIIKFLRLLENKGIIKNYGNQTMIIPSSVWNVLVKYADEIFEDEKK